MRAATVADDFYPVGAHGIVVFIFDVLFVYRLVETRPAGIAMKFGIGIEKRGITNNTVIHTVVENIGVNA